MTDEEKTAQSAGQTSGTPPAEPPSGTQAVEQPSSTLSAEPPTSPAEPPSGTQAVEQPSSTPAVEPPTPPAEPPSGTQAAGESSTPAPPTVSAEEAYYASLSKDDTLIKKPITLQIREEPDVKPTSRWGHVFLGRSAKLALKIRNRAEPIRIEVKDRFVIGRVHSQAATEKPDLDLNKYGAFFHGVSRQHVVITKDGNLLHVEDLGSTNGTYLNGIKLAPQQPRLLRDGDELCLGHLVITVSFVLSESETMA